MDANEASNTVATRHTALNAQTRRKSTWYHVSVRRKLAGTLITAWIDNRRTHATSGKKSGVEGHTLDLPPVAKQSTSQVLNLLLDY